ncbi:hypothetical protein [Streptomyces sp. NPDC093105]|uniref:hypothetical protein n=1 Tax=Streptomyces sp. NPDC093105 TaxID=3366029 RepID=UPI0038069470
MTTPARYLPGTYTPEAGEYVCDCAAAHTWRIDVAGHLFPAFPPNCGADAWRSAGHAETSRHLEPEPPA